MNGFAIVKSTDVDKPIFFGKFQECVDEMKKGGLCWNWLTDNRLEVRHYLLRAAKQNSEIQQIGAMLVGEELAEYELGKFVSYP